MADTTQNPSLDGEGFGVGYPTVPASGGSGGGKPGKAQNHYEEDLTVPNYEALMKRARKTNRQRDEIDRLNGNKTPAECGLRELIRTAMAAIKGGIASGQWEPVAEGQAMLEEVKIVLDNSN
jgi:hypothetical protein